MRTLPLLLSLVVACSSLPIGAAQLQAPPPGPATSSDARMEIVAKRQVGSFTLRWKPARDALGHERRAYDILVVNCRNVRSASGAPLPPAVGGRLQAMSGPPYAVLLSDCNCQAAANVHTATVAPETLRSAPAEVRRGSIFGRPC